ESSSAAFDECGAVLLAAEASADAAVVWRRNGLLRGAATLQRAGRSLRGCPNTYPRHRRSCSGCPHPPELEIARLAAAGLANREIAARLCLSHRTVENKLHAAYEKLGVPGRAELARALETT
ncbi:MAG: helix-turn-helix domain-containing protein, partial [Pseudonocardiaceae bacterium]